MVFSSLYIFVDICNILSEDSSEETPLTLLKRLQKDLNHRSCQVKKKKKEKCTRVPFMSEVSSLESYPEFHLQHQQQREKEWGFRIATGSAVRGKKQLFSLLISAKGLSSESFPVSNRVLDWKSDVQSCNTVENCVDTEHSWTSIMELLLRDERSSREV